MNDEDNPLMLLQAAASLVDQQEETKTPSSSLESRKKVKLAEECRQQQMVQFREAAIKGDLETIDRLLTVNHLHPGVSNNIAVIEAAKNGHLHLCERLLQDPRTNPTDQRNHAIRMAVRNGHTKILKLFLEHSKADPSADNNYAIRIASINGHVAIVKLLLEDPRVDPTVKDHYPIRYASKNKHWKIVHLLLQDARVCPTEALEAAKKNYRLFHPLIEKIEQMIAGNLRSIKEPISKIIPVKQESPISPVTAEPKFSPITFPNSYNHTFPEIISCASEGKTEELEYIISKYKSSLGSTIQRAIKVAAEKGHVEIIQYLGKEFPRINHSQGNSAEQTLTIKHSEFS